MTRSTRLPFLLPILCAGWACSAGGQAGSGPGQQSNGGAGGAGESADAAPPSTMVLCPANNLTQPCTCSDGSPGRQICVERIGWQSCDCGLTGASGSGGTDALVGAVTPPDNTNAAITFEDYVMPAPGGGDCKAGRYVGTFSCDYTGGLSPTPFNVQGVVNFSLQTTANSEVLALQDGLLDGFGVVFFFAYLNGELDCGTGDFAGTATDGFYGVLKGCAGASTDIPGVNCVITDKSDPGYVPWTVTLTGSYMGTLDKPTNTITGTWSMVPDVGGSCDGSFTVTYTP